MARLSVPCAAGIGLLVATVFLAAASQPSSRAALAGTRLYPGDLAGRQEIAERASQLELGRHGTIVAGDFALGSMLAFALGRADILVLDSPLNHKHGRAAQLRQWRLQLDRLEQAPAAPVLLIVDDTATAMKNRLVVYHQLCEAFGALPPPEVMNVDHGRKRYLIYRVESLEKRTGCNAPGLAWVDSPAAKQSVPPRFTMTGWAFKDGAGLSRVEVTLDGKVVATADYGAAMPNVADYWRISTDPQQPNVGFRAAVDASTFPPGLHWLGLRLHGVDGSIEPWAEQPIRILPP